MKNWAKKLPVCQEKTMDHCILGYAVSPLPSIILGLEKVLKAEEKILSWKATVDKI